MARDNAHHIERVIFNPPVDALKQCYGISAKWWPDNKLYIIPRIYDAPTWNKVKDDWKYRSKRLVVGWLKATIVFYWPGDEWKKTERR